MTTLPPAPRDPIAIIGMGCRLPGGIESPSQYWDALLRGVDAIGDVPKDRWDSRALYHPDYRTGGRLHVTQGGFVRDLDAFDAEFFGISPVEAVRVDPQQRLLLETTFRAFEDAGLRLEALAGSRTGVFVGISSHDYGDIQLGASERNLLGQHSMQGGASSIAANRISYAFDLLGPSFAVDTACSSSLVALHLACRSLWSGETTLAVVGGVNALIKPEPMMAFARGGFLSPDARCRAFDARANGYVRSEGCGVVVLKPLSAALRDGDPVYAAVLGSALNEDGRTAGLALPNPAAQVRVLEDAYRDAGVDPRAVSYVEAHGTGTAAGDPIEAESIGKVIGRGRQGDSACLIGSVKTNLGHLEPASGVAGLMKLALALRHRTVPPNLHFQTPNPRIDFTGLGVRVPTAPTPLGSPGATVLAGINSFGFGGANAHAVVRSVEPAAAAPRPESDGPQLFLLSARSRPALEELARQQAEHAATTSASLAALCDTAGARRSAFEQRLATVATTKAELAQRLHAFVDKQEDAKLVARRAGFGAEPKVAFVYSGQGPQWFAMGRELFATEPLYRRTVERIGEILRELRWLEDRGSDLLTELARDEATTRMNDTVVAQPALFALQVGLAELWRARGVTPAAVVGHSIGEVAAAYACGALTLEEATRVVFRRSGCQAVAQGKGRMLAAGLSADDAVAALAGYAGRVDLAAINGPAQVTFAGEPGALQQLADTLAGRGVFQRFLKVDVPFHSFYLDEVEGDFLRGIGRVDARAEQLPMYSTVTGAKISGAALDAGYWYKNLRQPVRFYPAMQQLVRDGYNVFVELAPHPILAAGMGDALSAGRAKGVVVPSLKRGEPERERLLLSLGELFAAGCPVDRERLFDGKAPQAPLPIHPWRRERFWLESAASKQERQGHGGHPHLGPTERSADAEPVLLRRVTLDKRTTAYIDDHRVQGPIVYPGAGHLDLALSAAREQFGADFGFLEDVEFQSALFLPDDGELPDVQLEISTRDGSYRLATRPQGGSYTVRSVGRMNHLGDAFRSRPLSLAELSTRILEPVDLPALYERLYQGGLQLGPAFRGMTRAWREGLEALAEVHVPQSLRADAPRHSIHPAVLDACFQVVFGILGRGAKVEFGVYIPVRVERVRFHKPPSGHQLFSYIRASRFDAQENRGDLWIFDADGSLVLELQGFSCRYLEGSRGEAEESVEQAQYAYRWRPKARRSAGTPAALPSPASLRPGAEQRLTAVAERHDQATYVSQFLPAADALAAAYAVEALRALEPDLEPGRELSLDEVARRAGVPTKHRKLLARLVELAVAQGLAEKTERGARLLDTAGHVDAKAAAAALASAHPRFAVDLGMLTRCGERLADVLTSRVDPLTLLFPEDEAGSAARFYERAAAFAPYNELIADAVRRLVLSAKPGATLRVLELGAGTGGLTQAVLPELPPAGTEYVFTDVSAGFLAAGAKRFAAHGFVEYRTLDVESAPEPQGFDAGTFDLVLASDVLHATRDVRASLANARRLLAPGGTLLLLELTQPALFVDLVFGLTDGWWRFTDTALRSSHCTLPASGWRSALEAEGFDDVTELTQVQAGPPTRQAVLLARAPTSPQADAAAAPERATWLLAADEQHGAAKRLAAALGRRGRRCIFARHAAESGRRDEGVFDVAPADRAGWAQTLAAVGPARLEGVVHLWALDAARSDRTSAASLDRDEALVSQAPVALAQAVLAAGADAPRLAFVTAGTELVLPADRVAHVGAGALWGLVRVLMNEHPALGVTLADLSADVTDAELDALADELLAPASARRAEEVAFRGDRRFVHRLERAAPASDATPRSVPASGSAYRVEAAGGGAPGAVVLREVRRPSPGPDEVLVAVEAASINFRDVMLALGLLPPEATWGGIFDERLGLDFAGRVVAVGKGVTAYAVGDSVLGIAAGSLAGLVVAKAAFVWPRPAGLTAAEAAALPIAYGTAHRALDWAARLSAGEKVLIHAAAGGVGLAATHLALGLGAQVYATAGTDAKRAALKRLGVTAAYDSRGLTFRDELLRDTGGRGVDVVLNSLSGKALTQSLRCLAPGGRFVEIGKRDLYGSTQVALRSFAENATYQVVDVDRLLAQRPELAAGWYRELLGRLERGALARPAVEPYPMSRAGEALEQVARSKHLGKVVVTLQEPTVAVAPPRQLLLDGDGTHVVVGGASGFGLAVAAFLAERGARHLLLLSRSGPRTQADHDVLRGLREAGVRVTLARADVTDAAALQAALDAARKAGPPIRGVVHSAMVLDDALLTELSAERVSKVLRPKVQGAWNLHEATRGDPLQHFVLFSSFSAVFGSPGQANYAAANAFLGRLGALRRGAGQPATVIDWGVLGDVGFVARTAKVASLLATQGWRALKLQQSLAVLEHALVHGSEERAVILADWSKVRALFPQAAASERFAHLFPADGGDAGSAGGGLGAGAANEGERLRLVETGLRGAVARVLGTSAARLDDDTELSRMGLDSLMAHQLRTWIKANLGVDYPLMRLLQGPTVAELARQLVEAASGASKATPAGLGAWLSAAPARPQAKRRLICFPCLGLGASSYDGWRDLVPADTELVLVHLPGREQRAEEPALADPGVLFDALLPALEALSDKPFAFYGHSFGAVLAFAVARELERRGRPRPTHLFAAAASAPHLAKPFAETFARAEPEGGARAGAPKGMLPLLRSLGVSEALLADERWLAQRMPTFTADSTLMRALETDAPGPDGMALVAIAGDRDTLCTARGALAPWAQHARAGFELHTVAGDHLFLSDPVVAPSVVALVARALDAGQGQP